MRISLKTLALSGLIFGTIFLLLTCSQPVRIDSKYITPQDISESTLSNDSIALNTSSPALDMQSGKVITDNDMAFTERLKMVQQAQQALDLGYYIYKDDYSSSVFSQALIEAAHRGVKVRLLVDYKSLYSDLDLFSMLEHYGNQGSGSLKVRFYNRPTVNIIKDAVYMTLGCGDVGKDKNLAACSSAKYQEIESLISQSNNPLNYNSGGSGLFLSAFYSGDIRTMALAIQQGQGIKKPVSSNQDKPSKQLNSQDLEKLIKLAKIYIKARHSNGLERLTASLKLKLAFAFFGGEINPYYDAFTAYLPIGREEPRKESLRDWNYITDFFHQKLILADSKTLMLGGRNIEDLYHMQEHPLLHEHQFMDTDVKLLLNAPDNSITQAFERLWQFTPMVATLSDIHQHAPNDFIVAQQKSNEICKDLPEKSPQGEHCHEHAMSLFSDQEYRIQQTHKKMLTNIALFKQQYKAKPNSGWPQFNIDTNADVYYVENLPFEKDAQTPQRTFGAENGKEASSGKYIHNLWLAALRNTCHSTTPQDVIIHSAYVFMPSNLLRQLSEMVSGEQHCKQVHIKILTNSIETTDLGIENLAARYAMKAFVEHLESIENKAQGARFSYYQYQPFPLPHNLKPSLHSKVMIFGEDLYIGSANADARSYMMDANNGLFIRNAPKLLQAYRSWFDSLLSDQQRVADITSQLKGEELGQMLEKDSQKLMQIALDFTAKSPDEQPLDSALQEQLKQQLKSVLEKIYALTRKGLSNDSESFEAQESFNELFKLI